MLRRTLSGRRLALTTALIAAVSLGALWEMGSFDPLSPSDA